MSLDEGERYFALVASSRKNVKTASETMASHLRTLVGIRPRMRREAAKPYRPLRFKTDGKIVAAGSTDVRGVFCGGKRPSFAMAPQAYAPASVENLSICDDFALARFNADGSLDTTFGKQGKVVTSFVNRPGSEGSSSLAEALGIQADGRIVVAGLGNGYDFASARYTTSGQLDASFGRGGKVLTDFGSG